MPKPGSFEAWTDPPTVHGFKGGDLRGITEHLGYLEQLGVTALYLNPIFSSASNHRYQTYDYLSVDPLLGGDDAFRDLLDEAHRRGMRVIVDGVFNHSGRGFWPFHHLLETGRNSPYRDWFHVDQERLRADVQIQAYPNASLPEPPDLAWAVEHASGARSVDDLGYRAWWDLPALPKLNLANPEVRSFLLDVAEHWTRFGVDGWRLDVPQEVGLDFWYAFRERVRGLNPEAYLVGEIWQVAPEWAAPLGPFDGLMNYPLAWAMLGLAGAGQLDQSTVDQQAEMRAWLKPLSGQAFGPRLAAIMAAYPAAANANHLNILGSHDTPRVSSVVGDDPHALKLAFMLLMAMPGAPCVFYGDEIGLRGGGDPACRASFPWDDASRWDVGLQDFVRAAIAARARLAPLRDTQVEVLLAVGGACVVERGSGPDRCWVVVNNADEAQQISIPMNGVLQLDVELAVGAAPRLPPAGELATTRLQLAARSGAILRARF